MKNRDTKSKLQMFGKNNKHCKITEEEEELIINNPWGEGNMRLQIPIDDVCFIEDLNNNILLNPQFDALIHKDVNEIEFIFAYLNPENEDHKCTINRSFEFTYKGNMFNCRFAEPTERLFKIAKSVRLMPSEYRSSTAMQIMPFRDVQRLKKLPKQAQEYFENRIPRSFFVSFKNKIGDLDLEDIFRHINFILKYYDRYSPVIEIRREETESPHSLVKPLRFIESDFPKAIALNSIDDIILQLLEVALESNPRFSFLYYYQIFEYAGFYYIDKKAKTALHNILRDPALISCAEDKVSLLFSCLVDLHHNDEAKMRKVIEEACSPDELWREIVNNKDFFTSDICFDGGFKLSSLISSDTTMDSWKSMWMPKLFDQITKIRNCIVHARERRINVVILPTRNNTKLINAYLPLIKRMAEQIAIRFS